MIIWQDVIDSYVEEVLSGRRVAGQSLKSSVQRYVDDLDHAHERGYVFDPELATSVVSGWPVMFRHSTGEYAGQPFVPYPWQAFILWNLFGWRRVSDGFRRFRDAFASVARGNGKSPLGATILLNLFAADIPIETRAECYCAATTREQAKIVFGEAARSVNSNPDLKTLIQVRRDDMFIPQDGSILKPLASDGKNMDGLVIHAVVKDEMHAWREQHRVLAEKIDTAMGKRRQPMSVTITTAGNSESDLWRESYLFSKSAAGQQITADNHFSCIHEADDDDDPLDPKAWAKANPMLEHGVVKVEYIQAAAAKASHAPEQMLAFTRYHCNRQVASEGQVISPEMWRKGSRALPPLDGAECYIGFDWGWRDDLAALALVFPLQNSELGADGKPKKVYAVMVDTWTPRECPRDLNREPWSGWSKRGILHITDGNTTDVDAIYKRMDEITKRYVVRGMAFDGNNCREFGSKCVNEWRIDAQPFGQSAASYNEPLREFLAALREGRIIHGGHELLGWCASHLIVKHDVNDYAMPSKKRSQDKIDPIVAVVMGISRAMYHDHRARSSYDTRELVLL